MYVFYCEPTRRRCILWFSTHTPFNALESLEFSQCYWLPLTRVGNPTGPHWLPGYTVCSVLCVVKRERHTHTHTLLLKWYVFVWDMTLTLTPGSSSSVRGWVRDKSQKPKPSWYAPICFHSLHHQPSSIALCVPYVESNIFFKCNKWICFHKNVFYILPCSLSLCC